MKFEKLVLFSAALGIGLVGVGYMISPVYMYGLYGLEISSPNEFNMVRGAYGGLFVGFSSLFLIGAFLERFAICSLVALFTFMAGFAVGRVASVVLDGIPSSLILGLLACEVLYSIASAYFINSRAKICCELPDKAE